MSPELERLEQEMKLCDPAPAQARRLLLFAAMVKDAELGDRALAHCAAAGEPAERVLELVLQAFLFAGFPRLINSLRAYREHFGDVAGAGETRKQDQADITRWRERGEALFRQIYAQHADRVLGDLDRYHEDLRDWILVDAYGKILGRPTLEASERELAAVSALIVSGDMLQLSSHMRGALNCGASPTDLDLAIATAAHFSPASRILEARGTLERILPSP